MVEKVNMSIRSENRKEDTLPSSKTFFLRNAHKCFCTHYNISGNWIEKCWKMHPHLHPKKEKHVMKSHEKDNAE